MIVDRSAAQRPQRLPRLRGRPSKRRPPATATSAATGRARSARSISAAATDGAGRVMVDHVGRPRTRPASSRRAAGSSSTSRARTLAPDLARRYDVIDFATPVNSFDVTSTAQRHAPRHRRHRRLRAARVPDRPRVHGRDQAGGRRQRSSIAEKKEYKGERLTLNFQDIETRAVLQLLAETSGQNIVVSDSVQGNVTLRLQNVPWDQALDIVLRTKGLDKRREGNVIFVAPSEELAAREKQQLEARKALTGARPGAHRVPAGQLCQGVRPGIADQVAGQELVAAVRARQRRDRRAHEHAAAAGHVGPSRRTSAGWCRRSTSRSGRC